LISIRGENVQQSTTTGQAPRLPPMGPGLVLRVLSKRARPVPTSAPGPLLSAFTLPGIDAAHLARYRAALGFDPDCGAVPLTWWYLPVQRAHMATMLSDDFPYRLAGMVHVENELVAHAVAPSNGQHNAPIVLSTRIDILPPTASGAVYCALATEGSAHGVHVFTCTSKYLAVRGLRSGKARPAPQPAPAPQGSVIDSWTLAPSSGRAYARVSGDWNPIHLTRWSARLMGLPAPIIHGMHSVARTCAALETAAARQVTAISVRFTAPLALGSTAVLRTGSEPGRYALWCGAVLAAEGAFTLS
jgi:acyl dehydratase